MLILGAAGSGKTTLLLNLAEQLLLRAHTDYNHPIPVIFHLSTWSNHDVSFDTWLVNELENRYQMPKNLSLELIQNHDILLLLDGLDEINVQYQSNCVDAINDYQQKNAWLSIAICSREDDYTQLRHPLFTTGAVIIQAINQLQCRAYLQNIDKTNTGINVALAQNKPLQDLLTTPLMLNIASIAYENYTLHTTPQFSSLSNAKAYLFSAYTQTMLNRKPPVNDEKNYSKENTCRWLSWLAHSLNEEKRSIFYLDLMQPEQITNPSQYWMITQGSVIICALITGLTLGLLGSFATDIKYSLGVSLSFAIIGGYAAGLLGYGNKIKPLSHIKLSWLTLRRVSLRKQLGNLALSICLASGVTLVYDLTIGISLGMLFFIFCLLINSFEFKPQYNNKQQFRPNEAIRQSLRNTLIASIVGGILGILIGFLTSDYQGMIIVSSLSALLSGLFFGGHTCIQHYLLRYFLWRNKQAPLHYSRFLEFSVNRIFLYRVGNGYMFIHRFLAEYFAEKTYK